MKKYKDLADRLTRAAQKMVSERREKNKPEFDDLGLDEAKIRKITHADGTKTKRKVSQSAGEHKARTGKSKAVEKKAARKRKKTNRNFGAAKQARKTRKMLKGRAKGKNSNKGSA